MKRFQIRTLSLVVMATLAPVALAQSSSGPALNELDCFVGGNPGYCVAPLAGAGARTDTRIYTGLVWELGGKQGAMPHLAFGLSSIRVRGNDRVEGGDLEFRLSIFNGLGADSLRLAYVNGNRVVRANVGGGVLLLACRLVGHGQRAVFVCARRYGLPDWQQELPAIC